MKQIMKAWLSVCTAGALVVLASCSPDDLLQVDNPDAIQLDRLDDVALADRSADFARFGLEGPRAAEVVAPLLDGARPPAPRSARGAPQPAGGRGRVGIRLPTECAPHVQPEGLLRDAARTTAVACRRVKSGARHVSSTLAHTRTDYRCRIRCSPGRACQLPPPAMPSPRGAAAEEAWRPAR